MWHEQVLVGRTGRPDDDGAEGGDRIGAQRAHLSCEARDRNSEHPCFDGGDEGLLGKSRA